MNFHIKNRIKEINRQMFRNHIKIGSLEVLVGDRPMWVSRTDIKIPQDIQIKIGKEMEKRGMFNEL